MHQQELSVALQAARAGAQVVRAGFGSAVAADFKGDADPVTEVDRAAEEQVLAMIRHHFPDDAIMAEESAAAGSGAGAWPAGRAWIVDPLDGTVNFIHGVPHVAVSVALWIDQAPAAAVVIDVIHGEEFSAVAMGGAFSSGNRIKVSGEDDLGRSLIATGFPYDRNIHGLAYADNLGQVLTRVQGVRRLGSAALDLAWVACGRYEGYWEFGLKPWDVAAGMLLVTEAGGRVTSHRGLDYQMGDAGVVASNALIHDSLLGAVRLSLPGHVS
ncbi:MAG TPA: inositol monophosphatase family protein [Acidimicrobiia bacterium]|nr:inositol monophosphatase family protein [Acidimicrobiia bacterium]